ncbi:MAG: NADP-dependent glyceraldehyde-3-phosphate dehydrogenase, partial [Ignisphaera sp.]|nr:NADP-dependent glyceraldehyde-3-phosphate dehydrogenase [Ignisphaera sp.]
MVTLSLRGTMYADMAEIKDNIFYFKAYGAGEWLAGKDYIDVKSPIDLSVVAKVPKLAWSEVEPVVQRVYSIGRWSIRDMPGWKRLEI